VGAAAIERVVEPLLYDTPPRDATRLALILVAMCWLCAAVQGATGSALARRPRTAQFDMDRVMLAGAATTSWLVLLLVELTSLLLVATGALELSVFPSPRANRLLAVAWQGWGVLAACATAREVIVRVREFAAMPP
jgi:hypothetical protein